MPSAIAKNRKHAFKNQIGRCYYCGSPMWLSNKEDFANKHGISLSNSKRFMCTAEHLTARCDGGDNCKRNIVAACLFCNIKRHQRKNPPAPLQYRAYIQQRLNRGKWHPKALQQALGVNL